MTVMLSNICLNQLMSSILKMEHFINGKSRGVCRIFHNVVLSKFRNWQVVFKNLAQNQQTPGISTFEGSSRINVPVTIINCMREVECSLDCA